MRIAGDGRNLWLGEICPAPAAPPHLRFRRYLMKTCRLPPILLPLLDSPRFGWWIRVRLRCTVAVAEPPGCECPVQPGQTVTILQHLVPKRPGGIGQPLIGVDRKVGESMVMTCEGGSLLRALLVTPFLKWLHLKVEKRGLVVLSVRKVAAERKS